MATDRTETTVETPLPQAAQVARRTSAHVDWKDQIRCLILAHCANESHVCTSELVPVVTSNATQTYLGYSFTRSGDRLKWNVQHKTMKTMRRHKIKLQLTPEERSLLLDYGYPFERFREALKACEASPNAEIVPIDDFELERLIGDLCYSINHRTRGATQDDLAELCDRLEYAERTGDGMLGAV